MISIDQQQCWLTDRIDSISDAANIKLWQKQFMRSHARKIPNRTLFWLHFFRNNFINWIFIQCDSLFVLKSWWIQWNKYISLSFWNHSGNGKKDKKKKNQTFLPQAENQIRFSMKTLIQWDIFCLLWNRMGKSVFEPNILQNAITLKSD